VFEEKGFSNGATILKFRSVSRPRDERFNDAVEPAAPRPSNRRETYPRRSDEDRIASCECGRHHER
jgi:hypothetical protein